MSKRIDYSKYEERYSSKNKYRLIFFLLIAIAGAILGTFFNSAHQKKDNPMSLVNPLAEDIIEKGKNILTQENINTGLQKIVRSELENADGIYAVAIRNLKTNETYTINEHEIFETASLYKLFVLATALSQVEKGTLSYDQVLSQEVPILNEKFGIATDTAELKEGSITLKVDDAVTKMITISDNYSALILSERVRISNITRFLEENGFDESRMGIIGGSPITTASDMLLFFEKLYSGAIVNKEQSDVMTTLLKKQRLNSKLPKYLPENIEMAHKTGELGRLSHDAGIVYTPSGDYIIIVLSDTQAPLEANEKMAEISKAVYEYFTK